ncbi:hypothetical protein FB446DRAFT_794002 [Lentinula raphanica]|nr:hypothetical protein FB446DRAFT_794002 [Lentinula raphanica]
MPIITQCVLSSVQESYSSTTDLQGIMAKEDFLDANADEVNDVAQAALRQPADETITIRLSVSDVTKAKEKSSFLYFMLGFLAGGAACIFFAGSTLELAWPFDTVDHILLIDELIDILSNVVFGRLVQTTLLILLLLLAFLALLRGFLRFLLSLFP